MTLPPAAVLSAPLPIPRTYGLLDAATVVLETERFPSSATVEDYPVGDSSIEIAGVGLGSVGVKQFDATIDFQEVTAFTLYLGIECTTLSARRPEFRQRLQAAFRARESQWVEEMLVSAAGTLVTPYLTDSNMQNFGAAVGVVEGIALLENAIARLGNGMIHVTPGIATAMDDHALLRQRSPRVKETNRGTVVVEGAGYIGAFPMGGSAPSGDQEWAFASGLVEVHRDNDEIIGPTIGQSMDRTTNDVQLIAERNYLLAWVGRQSSTDPNHVQAGVLIDRSV